MPVATEKHFTTAEVAKLWHLSGEQVRQIFKDVPGVLKLGTGETLHKRAYFTLRIPESIVNRVHEKLHGRAA